MSKILIAALVQVALAQNIINGRPYARTNIGSRRQFYLRDPESTNHEIQNQGTQLRSPNFNSYRAYSGQHLYQDEKSNSQPLNTERATMNNNEYSESQTEYYSEVTNIREEPHVRGTVNSSGGRYHHTTITRERTPTSSGEQRTFNTDWNPDIVNSDMTISEHSNRHQQKIQDQIRTKKISTDNPDILKSTYKHTDPTTIQVLLVVSQTQTNNPDIHSRFTETEKTNSNLAEARESNDNVTFPDRDNLIHNTLNITAVNNKTSDNKNVTDDKTAGDRWIWSAAPTTSTTTKMTLPDNGLDDRTSLSGDNCPTGEVKVKGICVPTH